MGILAVDCLFCRSCGVRRDSWHWHRNRHRGNRVLVGWLAATLRSARSSRWCSRLPRHQALSRCASHSGLVLFRWDAPLFFANAELFHQRVLHAIAESPTPVRRIIVTVAPVTSIDVTSADMLAELEHSLTESGIELRFAEMKDPVKDKLKRFELLARFGDADFYPTTGSA